MAEEEYFVRQPDSENARGPFSLEKLLSLAEAGQVDRQTLVYEAASESWKPLGENAELCAKIFPEKRKLTLRRRTPDAAPDPSSPGRPTAQKAQEPVPETPARAAKSTPAKVDGADSSVPDSAPARKTAPAEAPSQAAKSREGRPAPARNAAPEPAASKAAPAKSAESAEPPMEVLRPELSGMQVDDLLSAAEGDTEEMDQIRRDKQWVGRAISLALPMMAVAMLVSAVALLSTRWGDLAKAWSEGFGLNWARLLEDPKLVLGFLDLLIALLLALSATSIYFVLRIRLMLGLGYLGFTAFAAHLAGSPVAAYELLALGVFSLCVLVCTVTIRFTYMLICGLAAIASAAALGIIWNFPKLLA